MVGFNRRFSPHIKKMKSLIDSLKEPKTIVMTINAGQINSDHWTQNISIGGGRIIGECCHFIDLMRFLTGYPIISVQARKMDDSSRKSSGEDNASITLGFKDGSFGTILYLGNGSKSFSKERIEVFSSGRVLQLDNFRKLKGYNWPRFRKMNLWKQDKGNKACVEVFLKSVQNGCPAIPVEEIFEVADVTFKVVEILRNQ